MELCGGPLIVTLEGEETRVVNKSSIVSKSSGLLSKKPRGLTSSNDEALFKRWHRKRFMNF